MKKVFLHGKLGNIFGKKWEFDVRTPAEALRALFANNEEIERYINKKQQEGVYYVVKKTKSGKPIQKQDYELTTQKDIHVLPAPEGSMLALAGSILTAGVSGYITKELSKLNKESKTLEIETKSFAYNGSDNRYQQGSTLPLGYGQMKVGSNVISSCILNYEYDSEDGDIVNFEEGVLCIIPSYSKYYVGEDLGTVDEFNGDPNFSKNDPFYLYIKSNKAPTKFGANDGLYGSTPPTPRQMREKIAGGFIGTLTYDYNFGKGIDLSTLQNFQGGNGDWYPSKNDDGNNVLNGIQINRTSFVCAQSVPSQEWQQAEDKVFIPIEQRGGAFLEVGARYKNGSKENGVGWHKLESVGIYKSIDLVCEGPIEGFVDLNNEHHEFSTESLPAYDPDNPVLRTDTDDYLRGVYLNDVQVKEINAAGNDSYNFNEFDIDIAYDEDGLIGSENQRLLEQQYMFIANTTDYNAKLYGPRNYDSSAIFANTKKEEYNPRKVYAKDEVVIFNEDHYQFNSGINQYFDDTLLYNSGQDIVAITGEDVDNEYYLASTGFSSFPGFSGEYIDIDATPPIFYQENDKVNMPVDIEGGEGYFLMGNNSEKLIGIFDASRNYSTGNLVVDEDLRGCLLMGKSKSGGPTNDATLFKITGEYVADSNLGLMSFASPVSVDGINDQGTNESYTSPISKVLLNTTDPDIQNVINRRIDVTPKSTDDDEYLFWERLIINAVDDITLAGSSIDPLTFFRLSDISLEVKPDVRSINEEYCITHSIKNPLVEQAYVSLKVDQLSFVYPGDEVVVTFKLGKLISALIGAVIGGGVANAVGFGGGVPGATVNFGAAAFAAIAGAILGTLLLGGAEFKIGTKIENSGELWPNRAKFRIKYGNEGESLYSTDIYIYGIATTEYNKDIRIFLPPNPDNKDRVVKIYKLNRERNPVKEGEMAARYNENLSLGSVTEVSPYRLNYPNSVVIGTRVNSKDVPSIPKRNYHFKLKKVAVPSNYDASTRVYNGNWNGLFKGQDSSEDSIPESSKEWSDNPAWCLLDLITNKRYGVGKFGINKEDIDKWTLYRMAKYCDQLVPSGYSPKYKKRSFQRKEDFENTIVLTEEISDEDFLLEFSRAGKMIALYGDDTNESIKIFSINVEDKEITLFQDTQNTSGECAVQIDYPLIEPRYTINAFIMNQQNAYNLINEIAYIFRSYMYWSGGKINFFQDEKKEALMLFSNNNIEQTGFSYSNTPRTTRINSCKVRYADRYNNFDQKIEYSEDSNSIAKNSIIEKTIDGFGITSQAQAKRLSQFLIASSNLETEIVSFSTAMLGAYLKPGDVIEILDNKRTIGKFSGKVLYSETSEDFSVLYLSVDFPLSIKMHEDFDIAKKITLYNLTGNETLESLNEKTEVTDEDIINIRKPQILETNIGDIDNSGTIIKIYNNPFEFVPGNFTWKEAMDNAEQSGGRLAVIKNNDHMRMIKKILPKDASAWTGGFFKNKDGEYKVTWKNYSEETQENINIENWDTDNPLDQKENTFIEIVGSQDYINHGKFRNTSGDNNKGYIIENKYNKDFFAGLEKIKGSTFVIEDNNNLANKKEYKVMSIVEKSNGVFQVQAQQYNRFKFENIEEDLSLSAPPRPLVFTEKSLSPPNEISVTILEPAGAETLFGLRANWKKDVSAISYRVQFYDGKKLINTFEIASQNEEDISFEFRDENILSEGNYFARIYSVPI